MAQIVVLADSVEFQEADLFLIVEANVKYLAVVIPSSMPS
jgi:hypothetical protein